MTDHAPVEILDAAQPPPTRDRGQRLDDDVWAMAYVVAEILNGRDPATVVNDIPVDVRRRVIAVQHRTGPFRGLPASDQHGPLPTPPARASVMRNRVRTIDDRSSLPDARS
ncbi:hypothetical protein [uncultured Jatrophihabitans sp.]|uniref:hypothetical protein n=1 Tax=uncultured Jatrophihabitans sp. TaxID=1610747 RepID=UPI0035CA7337